VKLSQLAQKALQRFAVQAKEQVRKHHEREQRQREINMQAKRRIQEKFRRQLAAMLGRHR